MKDPLPIVRRGMTEIEISYNGKKFIFITPPVGPTSYSKAKEEVLRQGLTFSTGDELILLLHAAYCIPETKEIEEFHALKTIIRKNWLWVGNINILCPEGIYVVQDNTNKTDLNRPFKISELEQRLATGYEFRGVRFSEDGKVRFAPKGSYMLQRIQSPYLLSRDSLVIANYGILGARKLREILMWSRANFQNFGVNENPQIPQQICASMEDDKGVIRLGIANCGNNGFAFGLKK